MCEYLKRMSPQDMPTDDIRQWSGLAHSVVEYTGPRPFGMDGNVYLWLHEKSATQLLDMCDELDAKFFDLKSENAKLREENAQLKDENEKLTTLVCHLMYVKPRDVTGIMYKGEVLHFDKLLEEVGLRWEDA